MKVHLMHNKVKRCAAKTCCLGFVPILVMNALLLSTGELDNFKDLEEIFDDSFFNQLDERHFTVCPEQLFKENIGKQDLKRKRDTNGDDDYILQNFTEGNTEYWQNAGRVSAAYDIERSSPVESMPEKKKTRMDSKFGTNDFASSSWDSSYSDDSWDILLTAEDSPKSIENDSWNMTPQSNMDLPFASEAKNPIGHILSNGISSIHNESKTNYCCRACGKDLKGHQHRPTMHFMLPKHENCWHRITEDVHLSNNISKALYPPQYMRKIEKDMYCCKKCGQSGSKRKILSHVMGAKCKQLRNTYSDALAWSGIEDSSSDSSPVNILH